MELERRALYNSLRMNWIMDPTLEVECWQIEDYRSLPLDTIFERLEEKEIRFNKESFAAFAEHADTPEQFADELIADWPLDIKAQDQIYLFIFELWRRLLPEKPCLSIFCDELDYQIYLYDRGQTDNAEAIQDILANLQVILDENIDEGGDPVEVLEILNAGCANDIESFLYDFIAEQIDNQNYSYASDLLESFTGYVNDTKWFDFLQARLFSASDSQASHEALEKIIQNALSDSDLEYNLEVLAFMIQGGDQGSFVELVKHAAKLVKTEQDFQDLLLVSADYYHCLDHEKIELGIQKILQKRINRSPKRAFERNDPQLKEFFKLLF